MKTTDTQPGLTPAERYFASQQAQGKKANRLLFNRLLDTKYCKYCGHKENHGEQVIRFGEVLNVCHNCLDIL